MKEKDLAVEQLYTIYKSKGYITDDEIYDICDKYNLSVFDTDYVANKVLTLGILISNDAAVSVANDNDDELTDYAKLDYTVIYEYFLYNYPELKNIIDIARNTTPIQHGEMNNLVKQMRSGNTHVRDIAFKKYIRLALKHTYNYRERTSLPLEDIFQESCLSVLKAIDSYDPYKNSAFTSYCSTWIMQRIDRYIADHESFIRVPVHAQDRMHLLDTLFRECQELSDNEKIAIIEQHLNLSFDESRMLLLAYNESKNIYIDDVFDSYEDISLIDEFDLAEFIENNELTELLCEAMSTLTERECQILYFRFGLANSQVKTLEEIALYFGVTRERIRQIEANALRKLRLPIRSKKIKKLLLP